MSNSKWCNFLCVNFTPQTETILFCVNLTPQTEAMLFAVRTITAYLR
jgi:hypothetical protein